MCLNTACLWSFRVHDIHFELCEVSCLIICKQKCINMCSLVHIHLQRAITDDCWDNLWYWDHSFALFNLILSLLVTSSYSMCQSKVSLKEFLCFVSVLWADKPSHFQTEGLLREKTIQRLWVAKEWAGERQQGEHDNIIRSRPVISTGLLVNLIIIVVQVEAGVVGTHRLHKDFDVNLEIV